MRRMTSSTPICRSMRYEQQLGIGLAVRKYILLRRGLLASETQRKPGPSLSSAAKQEIDYLLARLSRNPHVQKLTRAVRHLPDGSVRV